MPGSVISRRTSGSSRTCWAMTRSISQSSEPTKSSTGHPHPPSRIPPRSPGRHQGLTFIRKSAPDGSNVVRVVHGPGVQLAISDAHPGLENAAHHGARRGSSAVPTSARRPWPRSARPGWAGHHDQGHRSAGGRPPRRGRASRRLHRRDER
jgi:hypothetical protein